VAAGDGDAARRSARAFPVSPQHDARRANLLPAGSVHARQHHAERVSWQTHETNHTAMRLYDTIAEKLGAVVYRNVLPR